MNQSNQPPRPIFRSLYTTDRAIVRDRGDLARRIDWAAPTMAPGDPVAGLLIAQPDKAAGKPWIADDAVVVYNTDIGLEPAEAFHDFTPQRLAKLVRMLRSHLARVVPGCATGLLDFGEMFCPQWARMPMAHQDRLRSGWARVWTPGGGWFSGGMPLGTAELDYDAFAALVMRRLLEAASDVCPLPGGWSYPTLLPSRLNQSGSDGEVDAGTIAYPLDGVALGCERNTALGRSIFRAAGRIVVQLYIPAMIDLSGRPLWEIWGDGLIPRTDLFAWALGNLVEGLRLGAMTGLPVDLMTHPMYQRADKPFHETMIGAGELAVLLGAARAAPTIAAKQPWAGGKPVPWVRAVELWGSIGTVDRVGLPIDQQLARVTEWARNVLWPTVTRVWP